jgi:hypothetical protein
VILTELDRLVAARRITGYTIEEDIRYLEASAPTLTYRMYADGAESHRNLGEFAAAMAELGAAMRLSRVRGVVAAAGGVDSSRQLCLTAELASRNALVEALEVVYERFTAAPAAAPGSWRFPDVRVAGAWATNAEAVYAHRWPLDVAGAVVLTRSEQAPLAGAATHRVQVLRSWVGYLASVETHPLPAGLALAGSTP